MNANERIKELVRQRDSARAWAVELEQRNEEAERVIAGSFVGDTASGDAIKAALRGEQS